MSAINAFDEIFETKSHPHARTRRTTFAQKLKDVFFVIAGDIFDSDKPHVGLIDYMTLGLSYGLNFLMIQAWSSKMSIGSLVAVILTTLINLPFLIARYAIASISTVLAFLPTLIVHGVAKLASLDSLEKISKIQIVKAAHAESIADENKQTTAIPLIASEPLSERLFKDNKTLSDLIVDTKGTYTQLTLEFTELDRGMSSIGCSCGGEHADFQVTLNLTEEKDKEVFRSILRLNIGGLTNRLEEKNSNFITLENKFQNDSISEAEFDNMFTTLRS